MITSCLRVALFLLLSVSAVFGTWQIPDVLIYEGKEYSIYNEILAPYFKKFPERNPKDENYNCSANWRGYKAIFEISNGELRLKDIFKNACDGNSESELAKAVPNGRPLVIDWYSGVLTSMDGNNPGYPYSLEFLYSFERYSVFEIDQGRLTIARHFDNEGFKAFKKAQFEKYKRSNEFRDELKRMTADGRKSVKDAEENIGFWFPFSLKKIH